MGQISDIIKGHVNEALDNNIDLFTQRMEICKKCPLYKETMMGPICNPNLYMNDAGDTVTFPASGYKKGCGCRLNAKTRLQYATCTHKRW
jgi:hypothetical protein